MAKTFDSLVSLGSDLRSAIAGRLGCSVENIPEANIADLAKSLGLMPLVSFVTYTTKAAKPGVYLSIEPVGNVGRFGGGGKVFERLGDPKAECSEADVSKMRVMADGLADRAQALHDLCDAIESK